MTRDTDAYANTLDKNILLQKYGMLKYQVRGDLNSRMTRTGTSRS